MIDAKALMAGVMRSVHEYIAPALSRMESRVKGVEATIAEMPVPQNGKDASPEMVREQVGVLLKEIAAAFDGAEPTGVAVKAGVLTVDETV